MYCSELCVSSDKHSVTSWLNQYFPFSNICISLSSKRALITNSYLYTWQQDFHQWQIWISQTLFFSFSVIVSPVSGKRGIRRRSSWYSTPQIRSLSCLSCPSLSRCLTTAPWTSRKRRSSTSLRRWWWAVYLFRTQQQLYSSCHRKINNRHSIMKSRN